MPGKHFQPPRYKTKGVPCSLFKIGQPFPLNGGNDEEEIFYVYLTNVSNHDLAFVKNCEQRIF